jgi:hypothetical protein
MKRVFLISFLFLSIFNQIVSAQDSTQQKQLSQLLSQYYGIKDALVADNSKTTALKAVEFIKVGNTIDYKIISEGNINALLKDATGISETSDIKKQRDLFSNLSNNMITLARSVKLSDKPFYQSYCPMKKANWLSNESVIKNPYYGSAMPGCGKVTATF